MDDCQPWKVLVVDDDEGIHSITRMVFRGYTFQDRPILLLNASSAAQAQELLNDEPNIAVAILDVVMETDQAGLDLVNYIRNQLENSDMRIILRTGHPGFAPEADVIIDYDINDYLSKAELSASRLLTSVVVALRSYRDLQLKSASTPIYSQSTANSEFDVGEIDTLAGVSCLSQQFIEQLLPLKKDIKTLLELDHKPMARAIIEKVANGVNSFDQLCTQFSPASANHSAKNQLINCEELLDIHSNLYLKRALEEGWIFDYHLQSTSLAQHQYQKYSMLLLLNCAMELAISYAQKSTIKLAVEQVDHKVVFSFNCENRSISLTAWQTLLKENLASLSSLAGVKIIENSEHSVVRFLVE